MKIAVFVPNRHHFGNILTQLPFLYALKKENRDCSITIWTKNDASNVLLSTKQIERVINYKKYSFIKLLNELNNGGYDSVYNLCPGSEKVHFAIGLSNIPKKVGHSKTRWVKWCYDQHYQIVKGNEYIANTHLRLLGSEQKKYKVRIIEELGYQLPEYQSKRIITMLPGGGAGNYKRWDIKKYLQVAEKIASSDTIPTCINFVLGPDEKQYSQCIPESINGVEVNIHQSPSIEQLISLSNHTDLAIANDCGPTHIFQMAETPLIMLWGWKNNLSSPYKTMCEWFYSHENSWCVASNEHEKGINSITVDKVNALALAQLNRAC